MIIVYKIETNKYDPISYGTNYLYNEFDRIQSFLIKQNAQRYKNILAKPVLSNGSVQWYANFNQPFSRINELNADAQVSIKKQYWEFRQHIDKEIQQLSLSRETEKQNWGGLLKEVFNEDDNVILSDGTSAGGTVLGLNTSTLPTLLLNSYLTGGSPASGIPFGGQTSAADTPTPVNLSALATGYPWFRLS